jgi:hypothetical protein
MKRTTLILAILSLACLVAPSTALALGPVDVDAKLLYWFGEMEIEGESDNMDGVGLDVDVWFTNRLGATVLYYPTSGGGDLTTLDTDYLSLDLKWKLFAPSDNSHIAVGLGYQDNELDLMFQSFDTSGYRVFVEGAVGFTDTIQGYASYVFMPDMSSLDDGLDDGDGSEYELGVRFAVKRLDIYAGYRAHNMSFDETGGGFTADIDNDGFVTGIGFRF